MAKRDYSRYELFEGRKKVYIGITNDMERRQQEHSDEGKKFDSIRPVGPRVTEDSARKWEQERIEGYRRNHGDRGPRYNKQ